MNERGVVFDIQRFGVHDGPGIRTLIFMKGCPLHCLWCHNPESLSKKKQLSYTGSHCVGCGLCVSVCPRGVHHFVNGVHTVDYSKCTACGKCTEVCCYEALEILGKEYTADELYREVRTDIPYYKEEGGVTLTGGEPMYQSGFVLKFLQELKEHHIHVCMETCGFAAEREFRKIAGYVDEFLFDYKATPDEKYRELTGAGSEVILNNLKVLDELNKRIILRCPLIPGVNDTGEHLEMIAELYHKYPNILRVEILPYHSLGEAKYRQIGGSQSKSFTVPVQDAVELWIDKLKQKDVNVEKG